MNNGVGKERSMVHVRADLRVSPERGTAPE